VVATFGDLPGAGRSALSCPLIVAYVCPIVKKKVRCKVGAGLRLQVCDDFNTWLLLGYGLRSDFSITHAALHNVMTSFSTWGRM
jgi:hypothetical protein